MRRPLALLVLLVSLGGCDFEMTQPVEIDLPAYAPRLVVGAFLSPDAPIEARFAISRALLDVSDPDASRRLGGTLRAALYDESGAFLDSLRFDPSPSSTYPLFRSAVVPAPGRRYELRASAPGLPPVRAVASVPVPVAVRVQRSGDALGVSWDDPPGAAVYRIRTEWLPYESPQVSSGGGLASFVSADLLLRASYRALDASADPDSQTGVQYFSGEALLRDAAFDGQTHDSPLTLRTFNPGNVPEGDLRVTLSVLSADFARYMQALDVQQASSGDPFVQPPDAFTNVEGGLGAFVGFASASVTLR